MALTDRARKTIEDLIENNRVVLFMKGNPRMPQCGFSANTAGILDSLIDDYATFNVLEDEEVREGIKEYGNWPTIPQLYIDKELVGGSDIVTQMFNAGELHQLLGLEAPDRTPPEITISDAAAEAIRQGMGGQAEADLHFKVDDHWRSQFLLQPATGSEIQVNANGVVLHMDVLTAQRARGARIDWVDSMQGSGLSVDLPLAPPPVKELSVSELKARLDAGDKLHVFDIRSPGDRDRAALQFATPLDAAAMDRIAGLDKAEPLVFVCHHGRSSVGAAEHFRKEGHTSVYNLSGGIDAWSQHIDPTVPRY